jgi:hypothetical protein
LTDIRHWKKKTDLGIGLFVMWLGITSSKYFEWKCRYGRVNEHNHWIPRDHWLEEWEKQAIIRFHQEYPLEGYRRLSFMMVDRDIEPGPSRGRITSQVEQKQIFKGNGI